MARTDPIAHLSRHPTELPPKLAREVLALGRPGTERLLVALADRSAWAPGSPAHVLAINALRILAFAEAPALVPILLAIHAEAPIGSALYVLARISLGRVVGPTLVEPLLAGDPEGERRVDGTVLLSGCGVRDPRIAARLEELLETAPSDAAILALRYRDPVLLPALHRAFDRVDAAGLVSREEAELLHRLTGVLRSLGAQDEAREAIAKEATERALDAMRTENERLEAENERLHRLAAQLRTLNR